MRGGARSAAELASELGVPVGSISRMLAEGTVKLATAPGSKLCERCSAPSDTPLCGSCRTRLASGAPRQSAESGADAGVETRRISSSLSGPGREEADPGSLRVDGSIAPAWRVRAGFDLAVAGQVERAELEAGAGSITLDAACRQSELRVGQLRRIYSPLAATVGDADRELLGLADSAEALQRAAAQRGRRIPIAGAVTALLADRWPDLVERLAAGAELVEAERLRQPALSTLLLSALQRAHEDLTNPSDLAALRTRARSLSGELCTVRAGQGSAPRSIVESLTECNGDFAGSLAVRGAGVHACDLVVGGDLVLGKRSGVVGGGHLRVGSRVVAPAIKGGAVIELTGGGGGERLRAGVVAAGVRIVLAGHTIPFPVERRDVVISIEAGAPTVTHGA